MNLKNRDRVNKIISIILVILWCLLIFYFSNQKGSVSKGSSNSIIKLLNEILKVINSNIDITMVKNISYLIRKLAHVFLYFVLYYLVYYVTYQFNIRKRKLISLLFCFLYAISDEVHQLFVPNRSFGFIDILIDLFGSLLANFIIQIKQFFKTCKKQ